MPEIRTVTTLKYKRDEITRSIAAYEKKLNQARADLAHIIAAIRIFEQGVCAVIPGYPFGRYQVRCKKVPLPIFMRALPALAMIIVGAAGA